MIGTAGLVVNNVTVEGAGYWYSEIYRDVPLPNSTPLGALFQCYSCQLQNFHIDSDAMSRATVDVQRQPDLHRHVQCHHDP